MTLYIQWTNETETSIQSYFSAPQDPEVWEYQGAIECADPRWADYYNAQPALIQQFLPAPV